MSLKVNEGKTNVLVMGKNQGRLGEGVRVDGKEMEEWINLNTWE